MPCLSYRLCQFVCRCWSVLCVMGSHNSSLLLEFLRALLYFSVTSKGILETTNNFWHNVHLLWQSLSYLLEEGMCAVAQCECPRTTWGGSHRWSHPSALSVSTFPHWATLLDSSLFLNQRRSSNHCSLSLDQSHDIGAQSVIFSFLFVK